MISELLFETSLLSESARIVTKLACDRNSTLEIARALMLANAELSSQEFIVLRTMVPASIAKRWPAYLAIARKLVADDLSVECLPRAFDTLKVLARLDQPRVRAAIASESITPSMTRAAATALLAIQRHENPISRRRMPNEDELLVALAKRRVTAFLKARLGLSEASRLPMHDLLRKVGFPPDDLLLDPLTSTAENVRYVLGEFGIDDEIEPLLRRARDRAIEATVAFQEDIARQVGATETDEKLDEEHLREQISRDRERKRKRRVTLGALS
jgi:hypothetical protein